MLRTLARTAVILAAAAMVAGALYLAFASHGPSLPAERLTQEDVASFHGHFDHGRARWDGGPRRRGQHGDREEASFGRGLAGAVGTAWQIGVLGAIVVGLQKRSRRRQRRLRGRE